MKTTRSNTYQAHFKASRAVLLIALSGTLTGCSTIAKTMPLNDVPTAVDSNFGFAVQRMKEIQQRPMVGYGPVAGYELDGSEAEKIMAAFEQRE